MFMLWRAPAQVRPAVPLAGAQRSGGVGAGAVRSHHRRPGSPRAALPHAGADRRPAAARRTRRRNGV